MPYGYLGQNQPNQTVSNSGVFSITDVAELQSQGKLGGSLELIEEQTYSSDVNYVDFTNLYTSKYDVHILYFEKCYAYSLSNIRLRFFESGVVQTGSVYRYALWATNYIGGNGELKSNGTTELFIANYANNQGRDGNGYIIFYGLGDSTKYSSFNSFSTGGHLEDYVFTGGGTMLSASDVDGIRVLNGTGTSAFQSYKMKLFGVKKL